MQFHLRLVVISPQKMQIVLNKRISLFFVQGLILLRVKIILHYIFWICCEKVYFQAGKIFKLDPRKHLVNPRKLHNPKKILTLMVIWSRSKFFPCQRSWGRSTRLRPTANSVTALYFAIRRLDKTKENSSNGISTLAWRMACKNGLLAWGQKEGSGVVTVAH